MSGWRGPGGPPLQDEGIRAFREALHRAVVQWRLRLASAPAGPREAGAIGDEAWVLKANARSSGWMLIANQLEVIERLSRDSPGSLPSAVEALERAMRSDPGGPGSPIEAAPQTPRMLPPGFGAPLAGQSVALPPLIDPLSVRDRGAVLESKRPPEELGPTMMSARGSPGPPGPHAPHAPHAPQDRRPVASKLPDSIHQPADPPKLLVKTVLGFRAFGKKAAPEPARSSGQPAPAAKGLLGLGKRPVDAAATDRRSTPGRRESGAAAFFSGRAEVRSSPDRQAFPGFDRSKPVARARPPKRAASGTPRWAYVLGGIIALLAIGTVAVVVIGMRAAPATTPPGASVAPRPASSPDSREPQGSADPMVDTVHRFGQETAELRALIDQQSRMIAACRLDATRCDRWARDALLLGPVDAGSFMPSVDNGEPLAAWLQRLKMPRDFPAKDDPALAAFYGYSAKHPTGRANFQLMLFRCSQYDDVFDTTLVKYGAPPWLKAVAYQESGCEPRAKSPVGARGIWQFMPESGRAYGLLVNEKADVDERLNPFKATEAAVHFLMDLHTKFGAWDLALAAYNLGPYGVSLRIAQVGGHASFWDLRRSDLLPTETADYVPGIEAYALVLENRRSLGFPVDVPLPTSSSELNVKPGTRLSLIARVARSSTARVKEQNLDFLGDLVPEGETTVRVPLSSDQTLLVQQALDNWPTNDTRDTCAPVDYVWGSGDFEATPYAKKCNASPAHP